MSGKSSPTLKTFVSHSLKFVLAKSSSSSSTSYQLGGAAKLWDVMMTAAVVLMGAMVVMAVECLKFCLLLHYLCKHILH